MKHADDARPTWVHTVWCWWGATDAESDGCVTLHMGRIKNPTLCDMGAHLRHSLRSPDTRGEPGANFREFVGKCSALVPHNGPCYPRPVMKGIVMLVASASVGLFATKALAFDHQWQVGLGASAMTFANTRNYWVPALSVHGTYGLSDVFDARLEMAMGAPLGSAPSGSTLEYAEGVLAYKLDVIEWVPWAGIGAGLFGATSGFQGNGRDALQPAASLWVGLDYAFSRQWGAGAIVAIHAWPFDSERNGTRVAAAEFGLRLERRFGW